MDSLLDEEQFALREIAQSKRATRAGASWDGLFGFRVTCTVAHGSTARRYPLMVEYTMSVYAWLPEWLCLLHLYDTVPRVCYMSER